VKSCIIRSTI